MIVVMQKALLLWRNEACVCGGHDVLDQIIRVKHFRIWPTGDTDEADLATTYKPLSRLAT
jgi:hypothetical protein